MSGVGFCVHVSEKTKEIILSAAKELFAQKGYFKTTYADIARHAGVNQATVYRGFKTKENIFTCLLEEEYQHITRETYKAFTADEPTPHKLKKIITANFTLTTRSKLLKYILHDEYSQFRTIFNTKEKKAFDEIRSIIQEGIEKGELKNEDPSFLLAVLNSFRFCLLSLFQSENILLESKYSLDHLMETINNIFVAGFLKNFTNHTNVE
jgi:AcrR family transcriptional regulator